ncbi:zinc finger CW-type PWWP domain protein 1 isoform X2 [Monodelphis domestica]|uniref:zinc finger CW-type PWWP domain protein 1 isoform X2 n=1 Tax=Monodelphis domestica TaxID=13616 RepID=UPI0024E23FAE|nr:zinc finger CW-type PWWP domain protein 1 isoform X2 [Monodelphis domestica]
MMMTLKNKEDGKEQKKTFAWPKPKASTVTSYVAPDAPNNEDTQEIRLPGVNAKQSQPKDKTEKKKEKVTKKSSGSDKEGKKLSLTNEQFEEIFQCVLQKTLQECLDLTCDKEKTKLTQESCKHRRKGQPRKIVQGYTQISDQEESGGEWAGNFGIAWVQCSFPSCEKWRQLHGNINSSSILPDNWSCSQNTGGQLDPDLGEYFLFTSQQDVLPAKYHVTFFGNSVSRAWISSNMLKNFQELSLEQVERDQVSLFGFSSRCKENASEPDSSEEEGDIFFKETKKTQSTGSSNSGFSKEESKMKNHESNVA